MGDAIANAGLEHAPSLDEIFGNVREEFGSFVHKHVNLAGGYLAVRTPGSTEAAAKIAARKAAAEAPPEPKSDTTEPCGYCMDVTNAAGEFLAERIKRCWELLRNGYERIERGCERIGTHVKNELGAESVLQEGIAALVRLKEEADECVRERERVKEETSKYDKCLGFLWHGWSGEYSGQWLAVAVFVMSALEFFAVFEALDGQLGASDALGAAFAAMIVVGIFAAMTSFGIAWFLNVRYEGGAPAALLVPGAVVVVGVLFFFYSMGALSAYRGDVVGAVGPSAVFEGYRSVMALNSITLAFGINLIGYCWLVYEFGHWWWHKAACFKVCAGLLGNLRKAGKNIDKELRRHKKDLRRREQKMPRSLRKLRGDLESEWDWLNEEFGIMKGMVEDYRHHSVSVINGLREVVGKIVGAFKDENRKWRTDDVYPEPSWFKDAALFDRQDSLSKEVSGFHNNLDSLETKIRECRDAYQQAIAEYEQREKDAISRFKALVDDIKSQRDRKSVKP